MFFEKISSSSWRFQVGPLNVLLIPSFTEGHFSKTDKREDEQTQPGSVLGFILVDFEQSYFRL